MSSNPISKLALALLAPLGFYTLHGLSEQNGLFAAITKATEARTLTDSSLSWPTWLNKGPNVIGVLLGFFWPLASGESGAQGTLLSLAFAGGSIAMWAVTMVEGWRKGNQGKGINFITIYGLLFQVIGIAVIGPSYLLLNLFLSPNATSPTAENLKVSNLATLKALPYALIAGFVVPTFCMSQPLGTVSFDYKVFAILFWQAFPLWTTVTTYSFGSLFSSGSSSTDKQLPYLRKFYSLALVLATASHVTVLALALGGHAMFKPGADGPSASSTTLKSIFLPTLSEDKVGSVAEGSIRFLQWDYAIASAAQLIWSIAQTKALGALRPIEVQRKELGYSLGNVWLDVVARSAALGPLGAALTLVWERDEVVLGGVEGGKN